MRVESLEVNAFPQAGKIENLFREAKYKYLLSQTSSLSSETLFIKDPDSRFDIASVASLCSIALRGGGVRMRLLRGVVLFACIPQVPHALLASHGLTEVKHLRCFKFPEKNRKKNSVSRWIRGRFGGNGTPTACDIYSFLCSCCAFSVCFYPEKNGREDLPVFPVRRTNFHGNAISFPQ